MFLIHTGTVPVAALLFISICILISEPKNTYFFYLRYIKDTEVISILGFLFIYILVLYHYFDIFS